MTRTALYAKIAEELKRRIKEGEYAPGTRMPGHIRLAREFGVSPVTSNRALQELTRERLIERRERAGSFVRASGEQLSRFSLIIPVQATNRDSQQHEYMRGCLGRAEALGLDANIFHANEVARRPADWLRERLSDGIVHIGTLQSGIQSALSAVSWPVVIVGCEYGPGRHFVTEDRRACTRELVEAMIADGRRTIGFVGNLAAANHRLCRDGYMQAISSLGLGPRYVRDATDSTLDAAVRDLLSPEVAVDAIMVAGGHLPIAAMAVVLSTRPEVCLGCVHESTAVMQLSAVSYIGYFSQAEAGRLAVDVLGELVAGKIAEERSFRYPPYRILRPGEAHNG